jgi:integrase
MRLTKTTVAALMPGPTTYSVSDSELSGFEVRVSRDGTKAFSLRYRLPGDRRVRRVRCGTFAATTVDEARRLALQYKAKANVGVDPAATQHARRAAVGVAELGARYLAYCAARLKPRTVEGYQFMWTAHVMPSLGKKKVTEVTHSDIQSLHTGMSKTPYAANRTLALLSGFFRFAEDEEVRPPHSNPTRKVKPFEERHRERYLSSDEIKRLFEALDRAEAIGLPAARPPRQLNAKTAKHAPPPKPGKRNVGRGQPVPAYPPAVDAIRFICFSGWRQGEVLNLRWSQIDSERAVVRLSDTKTGPSTRPLSSSALTLICKQERRRVAGSPFVFPSSRDPMKPIADLDRLWAAVRLAAGLVQVEAPNNGSGNTLTDAHPAAPGQPATKGAGKGKDSQDAGTVRKHDLRHTVGSILAGAGASLHEIASVLGHKDTATTARYAHLGDGVRIARAEQVAQEIQKAVGKPSTSKIRKRRTLETRKRGR